jgi:methionyl-tRNA formyltransferase
MIKVIFIGNRPNILDVLVEHPSFEVIKAFVIEQPLINFDGSSSWLERISSKGDLSKVSEYINNEEFDVCVSAGCSYILPVNSYPKNRTYINTHPSALPWGKGIHPINECIIGESGLTGATIHYLTSGLDCGDIIEQETFKVTPEIDISLLYSVLFELEAELLLKALNRLIRAKFNYLGVKQKGEGSYYSRPKILPVVNPKTTNVESFLKKVRAFSSSNIGVEISLNQNNCKVFSAVQLSNSFFVERYADIEPGNICKINESVLIVKFSNGLVYISKWKDV